MNSKVYDPHCHKYLFFVVVVLGVLHYFKEKVTIIASLFDSSDFPYSFEVYDFCFLRKTDYKKLYTSVGSESHSVKWVCWYLGTCRKGEVRYVRGT